MHLNLFHAPTRFCTGLAVLITLSLGACGGGGGYGGGGGGGAVTLSSISITPSSETVFNGSTARLTAIGNYSDGTSTDITTLATWTSSAPSTASVGLNTGVVTGGAIGSANVTAAMSSSAYGTVTSPADSISVINPANSLTTIDVTPLTSSIARGRTTTFTATGTFADSTTGNISGSVTWSSSDTTVATINASGIATGVGAGTCNITATLTGVSNVALVTLTVN